MRTLGRGPRQQDEAADQAAEADPLVQREGADHAEDELEGDRPDGPRQRVADCRVEGRVREHRREVVEADERLAP